MLGDETDTFSFLLGFLHMGKIVTLNLLQKEVYSELSEVRFLGRALVLISVEICSMQASRSQVPSKSGVAS
jgi:hypothetical protein